MFNYNTKTFIYIFVTLFNILKLFFSLKYLKQFAAEYNVYTMHLIETINVNFYIRQSNIKQMEFNCEKNVL